MLNDIGQFVGRYFQALGWLSIASMIISPIFFDALHIDLSFIFLFWAAPYLIKHHPTARSWAIGVCGFLLAGLVAIFVYATIAGTQGMTVTIGTRIESPSLWHVAAVNCVLAVLVGLPFALLLTPQARQEFQRPAETNAALR
jgi:hypothetical protein